MTDSSLTPFFNPNGIVVVGASSHPQKLGYGVARNLTQSGYAGPIYFVSPKGGDLFSRQIFASIAEVPDPVDLAVVVVPAKYASESMRACGERGIKAVILVSGGFRETGEDGAVLETETLQVAKEYGIRMIGPNCIGLLDTHLPLDTTFLQPPFPLPGEIAFISHSGAICAALIDWSKEEGFSFSRLISLGNQADVTETDILPLVAEDEYTRVITLYLENISNGARFIEEARRVVKVKPVIALKVGRSASGQRAAASHTGALAGAESAFDAAFEKAGVFRADTTEEIFDWARALAWAPVLQGRRIAILTNAGGPGVIAADALEQNGLELAEFNKKTLAALGETLPSAASVHNPVDMLASASAEIYGECLRVILVDHNVDGALVILPPPPMYPAREAAEILIPIIQASEKPVLVVLMGSTQIEEASELFQNAKIPDYRFPERAASALARLAERAEFLREMDESVALLTDVDTPSARAVLADAEPGTWLEAEFADRLMNIYGIPTTPIKLAPDAESAARLGKELGFPVVMKIASPDIPHKSDVNGILLNLGSAAEIAEDFEMLMARVQAQRPDANLEGVLIQRMISGGQEVILGAVRDPQFGALMMFGSGGVEVEGLKDVAFALAPLSVREAEKMLGKTWAGRKLAGYRNLAPADRVGVVDALRRLGQLAHDLPEIAEIEINPLTVLEDGVVAVDVRVKMA
ncbi:MAG: acetate--CoA ligase family protein [Anaerolineales bacterium]|uniref:Acetate--CoA ligase family protein n=1 Tax=Candidatus Desulfolinea nitratireducens TaxID=2841698 RepID=A0A8J6NKZ9_9CHLR|nr:acetate--CoA ligase family protein [Candidatus Desulfolinea nitratireducens]